MQNDDREWSFGCLTLVNGLAMPVWYPVWASRISVIYGRLAPPPVMRIRFILSSVSTLVWKYFIAWFIPSITGRRVLVMSSFFWSRSTERLASISSNIFWRSLVSSGIVEMPARVLVTALPPQLTVPVKRTTPFSKMEILDVSAPMSIKTRTFLLSEGKIALAEAIDFVSNITSSSPAFCRIRLMSSTIFLGVPMIRISSSDSLGFSLECSSFLALSVSFVFIADLRGLFFEITCQS